MSPSKTSPRSLFVGRYELLRELGAGGMGVVYLAYDVELRREVALKQMKGGPRSTSLQARFRREYQALAAVQHTGVPAIFFSGRPATDDAYFTMEIVKGETLREHLERGPLAPARALALAIDLGRVLTAVHAAGIVHRDVKPSNIIIETGDRVRLIDFGACYLGGAYYNQPHLRAVTAEGDRWGTGDLEFIGTAAYTDPQYFAEGITSPQSDVFSVCVVLYEMIAGRHLFDHETMRHRPIVPEEFAPELALLVAELQRGVSPTYARHPSMEDLVRRLEILRSTLPATPSALRSGTSAPRLSKRWARALVVAAAFVSGVLVARMTDAWIGSAASIAPSEPVEEVPTEEAPALKLDASVAAESPRLVVEDVAPKVPPRTPEGGADPGVEPPERAAPTPAVQPRKPALTLDARLGKAESRAQRCLHTAGAEARPLVVSLSPDAPADVRGVQSDSPHARCIREALERLDVRVDKPRRHTFFASQSSSP